MLFQKQYNIASSFVTMINLLTDFNITLNSKEQVLEVTLQEMKQKISSFIIEVYDGEGYLFWIKDGMTSITDTLHKLIVEHNKKIDLHS